MADLPRADLVRYTRNGPIASLTIDHPPVNVLTADVLDAIVAGLDRAEADPEARVVILRSAAPKAFAAGADIRAMAPMGPEEARRHGGRGQATTVAIEDLPLPVIAAVHGSCLGGGTELALACDFVLASDDAVFGQPEINLGVMPGWGGTQRLPRRIGPVLARRWIMTGRPVPAPVAFEQGFVDQVVPRAALDGAAHELAAELATKSATGLAAAKAALRHAIDPGRDAALAVELDLWARLFGTPDQQAGMTAFLAKGSWTPEDRSAWATRSSGFPWADRARPRPGAKGKNGSA